MEFCFGLTVCYSTAYYGMPKPAASWIVFDLFDRMDSNLFLTQSNHIMGTSVTIPPMTHKSTISVYILYLAISWDHIIWRATIHGHHMVILLVSCLGGSIIVSARVFQQSGVHLLTLDIVDSTSNSTRVAWQSKPINVTGCLFVLA